MYDFNVISQSEYGQEAMDKISKFAPPDSPGSALFSSRLTISRRNINSSFLLSISQNIRTILIKTIFYYLLTIQALAPTSTLPKLIAWNLEKKLTSSEVLVHQADLIAQHLTQVCHKLQDIE